jgi:general stress protein 26
MAVNSPSADLAPEFSDPDATAQQWSRAAEVLSNAELYWISTVRPDGRPHVTPLVGLWLGGAWYFCTGESERKAKNLAANPRCAVTTGCNAWNEGFDVVLEGEAVRVTEHTALQRVAEAYLAKYGDAWRFTARAGGLAGAEGNVAIVFEVRPQTAFAFAKGKFSQTRWVF